MNIQGHYIIRAGNQILVQQHNLITNLGESFFMNRAMNSEFEPIQYIVLGISTIKARKSDSSLGNETVRKRAYYEIDVNRKQIILSCSCSLQEVLNTCEIGTANDNILISHDIFNRIVAEDVGVNVDSVEITYIFDFNTSAIRSGWEYYSLIDDETHNYNVYYIVEEDTVVRVTEESSATEQSGYHAVNSLEDLKTHTGAYYHDPYSKNLFVRTLNNDSPENYTLGITTR